MELGGALKNVLAIACGISDGLGFGSNGRAALITRGLDEITRLAGEWVGGWVGWRRGAIITRGLDNYRAWRGAVCGWRGFWVGMCGVCVGGGGRATGGLQSHTLSAAIPPPAPPAAVGLGANPLTLSGLSGAPACRHNRQDAALLLPEGA